MCEIVLLFCLVLAGNFLPNRNPPTQMQYIFGVRN
jgi:hypothetical protein